jgi:hypothetical protein
MECLNEAAVRAYILAAFLTLTYYNSTREESVRNGARNQYAKQSILTPMFTATMKKWCSCSVPATVASSSPRRRNTPSSPFFRTTLPRLHGTGFWFIVHWANGRATALPSCDFCAQCSPISLK